MRPERRHVEHAKREIPGDQRLCDELEDDQPDGDSWTGAFLTLCKKQPCCDQRAGAGGSAQELDGLRNPVGKLQAGGAKKSRQYRRDDQGVLAQGNTDVSEGDEQALARLRTGFDEDDGDGEVGRDGQNGGGPMYPVLA